MANHFFQFKQFTITQQHAAMKVTTDSCLFGAVVAANVSEPIQRMLDIGTGTGLLSCMIAQVLHNTSISALDVSEEALIDAEHNISAGQFANINTVHCALQDFVSVEKYDLIVSNPPFYENQLKAPDRLKNIAHHDSGLSLAELLTGVQGLLAENGCLWVLIPFYRYLEMIGLATSYHLFPSKVYFISQSPKHPYFRCIVQFMNTKTMIDESEILIKDDNNEYTAAFTDLLKPYYLYL